MFVCFVAPAFSVRKEFSFDYSTKPDLIDREYLKHCELSPEFSDGSKVLCWTSDKSEYIARGKDAKLFLYTSPKLNGAGSTETSPAKWRFYVGFAQSSSIKQVAFSPDGLKIGIVFGTCVKLIDISSFTSKASIDPNVEDMFGGGSGLWDCSTTSRFKHTESIYGFAFSPDGTKIATKSMTEIKIWNAATGALIH